MHACCSLSHDIVATARLPKMLERLLKSNELLQELKLKTLEQQCEELNMLLKSKNKRPKIARSRFIYTVLTP